MISKIDSACKYLLHRILGDKNYQVLVSEPFDYKNEDGNNFIFGKVIKELSEYVIIFESEHTIEFNGIVSDKFILSNRSVKQKIKNKTGYEGSINGSIIKNYTDKMTLQNILKNSSFVFIGYVKNTVK